MSSTALPCIVCGAVLFNVYDGVTNQPNDGVACFTSGNYGSTVFDSFNGDQLTFNVCDSCLTDAGETGRVLIGRDRRPVEVDGFGLVGWESVDHAPVEWNVGLDADYGDESVLRLDVDELRALNLKNIHLNHPRGEIIATIEAGRKKAT